MNREQLAHIVRSVAAIIEDGEIVILGSQSILGVADSDDLPEEVTMSMEADVAFRDDPDERKADAVDGAIGELSEFHATFGYYAQGVQISTAVLPEGWENRVQILERDDALPGVARCLDPHDLVVSKLVAGRDKDIVFAEALIDHGFICVEVLHERAGMVPRPQAVIQRVSRLIDGLHSRKGP